MEFLHIRYMQRYFFPAFIATLVMLLFVAQVAPRNIQKVGQAPIEIVEEEVKEKQITEHKVNLTVTSFQRLISFLHPNELSPQTFLTPSPKPPRLS